MADTLSQAVLQAVKDTLTAYMPAKVPAFRPYQVKWHFTDRYVEPAEAPCILIMDRGWSKISETCRSQDSTGATVAGLVQRRTTCEIVVWLVGKDEDATTAALRVWCDGIAAVLDASPSLDETKLMVSAKSGANHETVNLGTQWFGAGQVRAEIDEYIRQGEVAL